jgi:hypothetical protein
MIKLTMMILSVMFINGCQTSAPACTKILSDFYKEAASDGMNMDVKVEENRKVFLVFNNKDVRMLCFNASGADYYKATNCASNARDIGACRWKDGRYMGYAYGDATPQDLLEGIK